MEELKEKTGTESKSGYFHEVTVSESQVKEFDREAVKEKRKRQPRQVIRFTQEELDKMKVTAFPWEDQAKVDLLNAPRQTIYARKCQVQEIYAADAKPFLEMYHLQGNVKGQKVCLALMYEGEMVELMTFGTPRYNKKFQWELLRLCSKAGITVVGGSSKLFAYFVEHFKPESVLSYCNNAKFDGSVYKNLGFTLYNPGAPTAHWWHEERKIHITDNFLRGKGFDLLFGHIWGKFGIGTDNEALMLEHGFIKVFDAGQATWIWKAEKKEETAA